MLAEYRPQLSGSPTSLKLPLSLFFQTNPSNRHGPMTCTLAPFPVVPIGGHATKFHFIKVLHQQHSSVVHTCISSGSSPHRVECISFRMGSTAPPPTISQRLPAFAGCCFCSLCCVCPRLKPSTPESTTPPTSPGVADFGTKSSTTTRLSDYRSHSILPVPLLVC